MKPTEINHELRTIHLEYNSDKPLSDFETEVVMEYLKMHNTLAQLQKRHSRINGNLLKLETDFEKIEKELCSLEEEIKKCGPLAGYSDEECTAMGITEGTIDVNEIINKASTHQSKMDICFNETHALRQEMKEWEADADKFEEAVEHFRETYFSPIINDYAKMEIYSCSLDEDIQGFYGLYDELFHRKNRVFVKTWNQYVLRFNDYLERVRILFSRVDNVQEKAQQVLQRKKPGNFGLN